jgi:anti-sigma factor RsiW
MEELRCREVVERLTDYLEGALPAGGRARLHAHLAGCRGCRDHLRQLLVTIRLLSLTYGRAPSPGRR